MSLEHTKILNEMNDFEKSNIFEKYYDELIYILKECNGKKRISSKQLEAILNINGSKIRLLVKYARRAGVPIGSDTNGYFYANTSEELESTINHMKERMNSIKFTIDSMEHIF